MEKKYPLFSELYEAWLKGELGVPDEPEKAWMIYKLSDLHDHPIYTPYQAFIFECEFNMDLENKKLDMLWNK